tara:strand:- start:18089 stop:18889 length:801 start_codon:yes stop_codon:yes gene_type:complete
MEVNHSCIDDWIVVTASTDRETIDLCAAYTNVRCLVYDGFLEDIPEPWFMDKCKAIKHALENVRHKDWILMLDSDSCLPIFSKERLNLSVLNPEYLYGVNRIHADTWYQYNLIMLNEITSKEAYSYNEKKPDLEVISGYFQLFHWDSSSFKLRGRTYVDWPPLDYEDRLFSNVWRKSTWDTDPAGPLDKGLGRRFNNFHVIDIGANNQVDHHKKRKSRKRSFNKTLIVGENSSDMHLFILKVMSIGLKYLGSAKKKLKLLLSSQIA